jgi:hypothetical protein
MFARFHATCSTAESIPGCADFELRPPNFERVFPLETGKTTYASRRAFKKKLKKVKKSLVRPQNLF